MTAAYAATLRAVAADLTPADRAAGAAWYADARGYARAVARETGRTYRQVAGIVAAVSPRVQWASNKRYAAAVARTPDVRPRGCMRAFYADAARIAGGARPLDVFRLTSPKRRAFYRNIIGDESAVTVDVWAARAAGETRRLTPVRYAAIADAYRQVAAEHGMTPAALQAAVWVHVRGRAS